MGSENESFDLLNLHRSDAGFNGDFSSNLYERNNAQGIRTVNDKPNNALIVSEIECTLKKHTDNLLRTLQGVSARMANLEIVTSGIERSVEDLKVSVGNNYVKGRLGNMENVLMEVQEGLQILRKKQETIEALRLAKLQASEGHKQSEKENSIAKVEPSQGTVAIDEQSNQLLAHRVLPPNVILPPFQQNPTLSQPPKQLPASQMSSTPQREPYIPARSHFLTPSPLQCQPFHQQTQPQQQPHVAPINPSQLQPQLTHHPEETMYTPQLPQSYPPSVHQSYSTTQPITTPLPAQQYYDAPSNIHEYMPNRQTSGFYDSPSGSNYYNTSTEPSQRSSFSSASDERVDYPQLPTAQILTRSLPSSIRERGESSSSVTETTDMKIEDVIDSVVTMGFSRDQVRATAKELTDHGQKVDLNMVLDKLMKDGDKLMKDGETKDSEMKRKKGWFGR